MKPTVDQNDGMDLVATLVQIAHQRGSTIERLRAEQLLAESRQAWPGETEVMWSRWLAEGAKSIGLRARTAHISLREALDLVEDGALLVSYSPENSAALIVNSDGEQVEVLSPSAAEPTRIREQQLSEAINYSSTNGKPGEQSGASWLVVEDLELGHEPVHAFHNRPVARLLALLRPESSDIWIVGVFAFFAGVLSLATPIAVESLVNIVAFGRLIQPLVILSLMLFGFLAFASMMRALQTFVVEIIQRRLFTRISADLAYRFPRVSLASLDGHYGPELANRFFDIVTLQKVVAQLLLDGVAIVLATVVGMAVLAFYHPWLLGFDLLLLGLIVGGVLVLGRGAIKSGIDESKQKYRLAAWLEDLIRCQIGFKSAGAADFALDRANQMTAEYLAARRKHFRVLFRQLLFIFGLQAIAGTILLGFGGWLVIRGQLTLGQLVAAELIVMTILASLAKLGKHIEGFYDIVASVDKLGYLFDLEMEPRDGLLTIAPGSGARLRITDVHHDKAESFLQDGFSLSLERGEKVALLCQGHAGSLVLLDILYGLRIPESGHVEIEHADPRDLRPDILRSAVALARSVQVFDGTIAENIHMSRPGVSMTDVRSALYAVGLLDDVLRLPDGLDTELNATGTPLVATQLHLLMLARAIAGRPRLLLIDGLLDALGDEQLNQVCEALGQGSAEWTLLVATNRHEVAKHFSRIVETPKQAESRSPELVTSHNAEFIS
ncbi:MAG: ABC transporter ATP-binding protein/permease [Pirellulales bacterium]|nr:ABC transporter ATP-binding protein/permease [Pirellulales bacterium]